MNVKKGIKTDDVYEGQQQKLRDKKSERKQIEKESKLNKEQEIQKMGESI